MEFMDATKKNLKMYRECPAIVVAIIVVAITICPENYDVMT